ncbi:serine protease inhibitor 3/4-like isoform X4 [Anthonomus grandis grandis]|uniref:serine protease inhibitor 3/4-like isoform X4 n=1 Tax=Anthonomus grandis grandis TaxID=2921223 RepID=UPI002166A268|nr:serine protease inhibitor 3/4-like isoform X4 [Anthonomus grandis grandis]
MYHHHFNYRYVLRVVKNNIGLVLNNILISVQLGLLLLLPLLLTVVTPNMASVALRNVVQGNSEFTQKLHSVLAADAKPQENIFFSPISAHAALSMAYQGARGATSAEFAQVLNIKDQATAANGYNEVMRHLNSVENVTLHIANKIYVDEKSELNENFHANIKRKFLSEVEPVSFRASLTAAQLINSWVEGKTNNKIHELVQPNDLNEDTRMVLVNAIYFKGNWKEKFNENDTRVDKFHLNAHESVDVQMMHKSAKFLYKFDANLEAQVLELPYANEDISMIVVLPDKVDGIADLESKLADYDLTRITQDMYQTEVSVTLPKFKIETTMQLNEPLQKLGLKQAFTNQADFSDMIKNEALKISKVVQKAFIEVNEEGSEAAAATAEVSYTKSAKIEDNFTADRPFVVYVASKDVRQMNTPLVLFYGTINRPTPVNDIVV